MLWFAWLNADADAYAIYLLNLLLAFLQPRFDPSMQEDLLADEIEEGGDATSPLPSQRDDEFRPFVRRLPEWQFWWVLVVFEIMQSPQPQFKVGFHACDPHCLVLYIFRGVWCSRLLADPCRLFLHSVRIDNAPADPVRPFLCLLELFLTLLLPFQAYDKVQVYSLWYW